MSKNLTTLVKHPLLKKDVAGYARRDESEWGQHMVTRCPGEHTEYLTGPVVDRLYEFESIGLEPDEIKHLVKIKPVKTDECHYDYVPERAHEPARFTVIREILFKCPTCGNRLASRSQSRVLYGDSRYFETSNLDTPISVECVRVCGNCPQRIDWSEEKTR